MQVASPQKKLNSVTFWTKKISILPSYKKLRKAKKLIYISQDTPPLTVIAQNVREQLLILGMISQVAQKISKVISPLAYRKVLFGSQTGNLLYTTPITTQIQISPYHLNGMQMNTKTL